MTRKILSLALMLSAAAAWAWDGGVRKDATTQKDEVPAVALEARSPDSSSAELSDAEMATMSLTTESTEGIRVADTSSCLCACGHATSACHAGCSTSLPCHQSCEATYQACVRACY